MQVTIAPSNLQPLASWQSEIERKQSTAPGWLSPPQIALQSQPLGGLTHAYGLQ